MKASESGSCMRLIRLTAIFSATRNCPKSDFSNSGISPEIPIAARRSVIYGYKHIEG